jgi:transposase
VTDTAVASKPEGYVFGRPTKYRPEMCEQVIEWGREGKSRTWMAANLGIDRSTIDRWADAHDDFRAALSHAKALEQAWWEDEGQRGIRLQGFGGSAWGRSMAARFPDDWRETTRNEHTGKDGGPMEFTAMLGKLTKSVFPGDETDSG